MLDKLIVWISDTSFSHTIQGSSVQMEQGSGSAIMGSASNNYTHGEIEDYNVVVASTLGTSDIANPKNDIQIYPNPVSDVLNITNISDKATFKIYSAAGRLVQSRNIHNKQINMSSSIKVLMLL
ncbi:T9SS type A sorting domain-containing protein [Chryseobacterium limigenitum]|uniref:Por secretion system C-terminal sorting domain-containing protein n=1 Tax=Chryseobacterium limigenitum TaxID=1612149 RepID=A0A1K2IWU1_9FLAO|nr:T9SS type A sorting domain-containing protein [Chryseobacterium limigenitum]SFZ96750.1 Por secretion system C-terminal sorting domain-containing protein [Chryseobacterium limigenitum]